ncbi:hypothetical protein POTOM_012971 [Populus tomentosa]|uniref:Uncharacterized protein n=1 Tax=Populus tomentosa TaxID=118781 RepID=A0A8X8A1S1_POPTO|nr:hypothetical protein POTOM_012971 [Populus tomentosa]
MMQYVSTEEDKEWFYRSLVGNILPNVDVATMEATILQTVDKVSRGNIVSYDTTCVSQGFISGIRVLINTIKLEPLHDQVILKLDGTHVDVSLQEIKGELIPSLTTVKHSIDISLYTKSVLSNDEVHSASLKPAISSKYLYPEITEVCRHAVLSDDCIYDDGNRLALVPYEYVGVAIGDCIETTVQQTRCFFKKDGLD